MPDETFDAVICGGGTKALFLAMYLAKYGGMSVGIFERRHEIGGGLATEELSAPGFRGNTHANMIFPWYYCAVIRDFPQFWDYGGQWDQYHCSDGAIFKNNDTCLGIYGHKHDPTQERTAKQIARFSEKDAERWLKLWEVSESELGQSMTMDIVYSPIELQSTPEVQQRQMEYFLKLQEAGFDIDSLVMAATPLRAGKEFFDSPELQYCVARFYVASALNVNDQYLGAQYPFMAPNIARFGFIRGGTHQAAHAAHQVLVQMGVKFFTHAEVTKINVENGVATGIRLKDGSEIKARKLVISAGLSPQQLCLQLLDKDIVGEKIIRRVSNLSTKNVGCLMWYSFALHEAPHYKATAFNPDIDETFWLALAPDANAEHLAREQAFARMGMLPPTLEDYNPTVWCHSLVDPAYAPPGKQVAQCEMQAPGATYYTEQEWLKIKQQFAENVMKLWGEYAPNMTWDNIIGVDTNSPYDCLRMANLAPDGNFAGIDRSLYQLGANKPTPELANHRTPVKNDPGSNASDGEAYSCYKIIANDLDLGKPWEEQGKEEPYSLIEQTRITTQKAKDSFGVKGQ